MSADWRESEDEGAGQDRWMVSFADFITLMFALFTVLYATSNRDLEKTKEFQESIKRFLIKAGAFGGSGEKINQGEKYTSPIEPPIQTYNQASPLSQETFDEAEKFLDENLAAGDRNKYVLDVQVDHLGVRLVLDNRAVFAANSPKFNPAAVGFLDRLGDLLARTGRRIMIEGHWGGEPIRNQIYPSDWEFSSARSLALVRYFIKRHKIEPNFFVPIAFGSSRPMPSAREQSDRTEVIIMTEDLPL